MPNCARTEVTESISFANHLDQIFSLIKNCEFTSNGRLLNEQEALNLACQLLIDTSKNGGIVYTIGNGGSHATASHFYLELLKNLHIPAVILADCSLLTSISNDLSFENSYGCPLDIMFREIDLLVVLSGSGKSPNLLQAVECAKKRGGKVITLSGCVSSNPLRALGNLNFWVNSKEHGLIEIAHFFLLHTIIDRCLENLVMTKKP